MSIKPNSIMQDLLTAAILLSIVLGCESSNKITSTQSNQELESVVIFDTGRGTGQYDKMTYTEYKSEIEFTPQEDINVTKIIPQIWYCNGSSGYLAFIRGEHFEKLAASAGIVDGDGYMVPTFSDRLLDQEVTLKADSSYLIIMTVWTTKSVGIYTTGERNTGIVGEGQIETNYAYSNSADHIDRGGIAFQLIE